MISGVSRSLPPTKRMPQGVAWPSRSSTTANSCSLGLILMLKIDWKIRRSSDPAMVYPENIYLFFIVYFFFSGLRGAGGSRLQSVKRFVRSQSCSSTNFKIQFVFLFAATAAAAEYTAPQVCFLHTHMYIHVQLISAGNGDYMLRNMNSIGES